MDTSKLEFKANIMDENAMKRALRRIAHEIIEKNDGVDNLKLVGIQRRGVTLAKLLQEMIEQVEGVKLPLGVLDITFYRDDLSILSEHPVVNATELPFQVQDARIVMVDDVLFRANCPRRDGCHLRYGASELHSVGGHGGQRTPRPADPCGLCGQEPADEQKRAGRCARA